MLQFTCIGALARRLVLGPPAAGGGEQFPLFEGPGAWPPFARFPPLTARNAADGGVTAWLARPVQRERPNERFLISTLRSVQAHNRRAEEEEMWERFEQRRQREEETARGRHACGMGGKHRSRSRSRSRSSRDRGRQRSLDGSPLPGKQRRHRSRSGTRSSERRHEGISNTGSSPLSCHGAQEPSDGIGEPGEQLSDEEIAALIASKRSRYARRGL